MGLTWPVALFALHVSERLVHGDRGAARPLVTGDVTAHAIEIVGFELRGKGGVSARVGGAVPHLARVFVAGGADLDAGITALASRERRRLSAGEGDTVVI